MKKFYNIELINPDEINNFRIFLKLYQIYFEVSAAGSYTHFEVELNPEQLEKVNGYLESGIQNTIKVFDYCIDENTEIEINYIEKSIEIPETNRLYFINLDGLYFEVDKL